MGGGKKKKEEKKKEVLMPMQLIVRHMMMSEHSLRSHFCENKTSERSNLETRASTQCPSVASREKKTAIILCRI